MSLYRAAATVGGLTAISRVTGFARDVLIAATLGAGPLADAFFVAFKLPNLFRRLTAEGAFTVAFVPIFARTLEAEGEAAARRVAEETLAVLGVALAAFFAVMVAFMPSVMVVLAPGFVATPDRFDLAVELTRITFIYLPMMSLVALFGGVLNAVGRFGAMAGAPILLNVILIATMVGLGMVEPSPVPSPAHGLAWGVAVAGVAQFLWLLSAARAAGYPARLRLPRLTPAVREIARLMGPAMLGAGVVQINLLIDIVLASTLPEGSVSWLYYGDRVNQLPLGVVGVAIGTALLPALSRQLAGGAEREAAETQNRALELGLLLTVPAAVGLAILAEPMMRLLFERGAYDATDTAASAGALATYALGLPAFVLVKILQPGFFARKDTTSPVVIAAISVVLNLILNLILMQYFAHVGLALATSIAAFANAGLLWVLLRRRTGFRLDPRSRRRLPGILAAAAVMGAGLAAAMGSLEGTSAAIVVPAAVVGGAVVYFGAAALLGAFNPRELRAMVRRG